MTNVHDVAAYILAQRGAMTAMKLQKLVYYSQAWHLVWDEETLFDDEIEAWANGPVTPNLYAEHRGQFRVTQSAKGDPSKLTPSQRESVDVVLDAYGHLSAVELSERTHQESPWSDARAGLSPGQRGNAVITPAAMAEYYTAIAANG